MHALKMKSKDGGCAVTIPFRYLLLAICACAEKDLKKNSKKLKSPPLNRAVNFYLNGLQSHVFEHQR